MLHTCIPPLHTFCSLVGVQSSGGAPCCFSLVISRCGVLRHCAALLRLVLAASAGPIMWVGSMDLSAVVWPRRVSVYQRMWRLLFYLNSQSVEGEVVVGRVFFRAPPLRSSGLSRSCPAAVAVLLQLGCWVEERSRVLWLLHPRALRSSRAEEQNGTQPNAPHLLAQMRLSRPCFMAALLKC